jgi:hypothetical protein
MFDPEIHREVKFLQRLALLSLIILAGCKGEVVVPQHLIGVWETPAPRYASRYMKITGNTLIYGIGDGQEIAHEIKKIDTEQAGGGTLYTFYYKDSEEYKWALTFTYSPDTRTIQIKNSKELWKQTKSGGAV